MAKLPKIFIIGTGGTISAKIVKGIWKPGELTEENLLSMLPELKSMVRLETTTVFRMDSTNMQPEHWLTLAQIIYYKLDDVDGIVITHGTDTMQHSASAISFLIQNLNIPVVFTGCQILPSDMGSDARRNLLDAIRVAANADLAESVIVFNGKIFRGNRTKKFREIEFNGFNCVGMRPLGLIEGDLMLTGEQLKRGNKKPVLVNKIEPNVALLKIFPGFNPKTVEYLIDSGIKGIVLEGYGPGNTPTEKRSLIPAIKRATERGVPVVITTQCVLGPSWAYVYEVGTKALDAGAIPGYDMLSETALVKLMWTLGQTKDLDKIKKMMLKNYAGEITSGMKEPKKKRL